MLRLLALLLATLAFGSAAMAQTAGRWIEEFTERPAEWGGDIRYAILDLPGGQTLQLGCTPNRIERILIVFGQDQGIPAPIAPSPNVRYSIDGEPMQDTDWRLFEAGSVEAPRGAESAEITRRLQSATNFRVEASRADGGWQVADFDLAGIERVLPPMLQACNVQ